MTIPVIDLSLDDDTITQELYNALTTSGFATLINHGISQSIREAAFAHSQAFFALPLEAKLACAYRGHASNRGYIGCGQETHDHATAADRKETYDINPDPAPSPELSQPWPTSLEDSFPNDLTQYFNAMDQLHQRVLRWIERGLNLPEQYLWDRCNQRHENLRLLHYPEIVLDPATNSDDELVVRGNVHTDFGTITLLLQDSCGGLQVQGLDGTWIAVTPVPDSVVVNVGDMLQRWTNDVLKANPHQVVQLQNENADPTKKKVIPERFSIAFFCNANKDTVLECLEQCVSDERPAKYPPINAFDYITQRLTDTIDNHN